MSKVGEPLLILGEDDLCPCNNGDAPGTTGMTQFPILIVEEGLRPFGFTTRVVLDLVVLKTPTPTFDLPEARVVTVVLPEARGVV